MTKIDALDNIITKRALAEEASLKLIQNREPFSPELASAIREVSLLKLIKLEKLGKISKEAKIK